MWSCCQRDFPFWAYASFKTRFDAKLVTRDLMENRALAESLPPAQSLRELVMKYRIEGYRGDDLLEMLIGKSSKTNAKVDAMFQR